MIKKSQQSGQTLLIVIFAITLGLVTLVAISTRVVNSTKRVFIDNAYYKAQAVAEAGAESFLVKTNSDLQTLVGTCNPSHLYDAVGFKLDLLPDHANCVVDLGESRAAVAVEIFPSGSSYEVSARANSTLVINLVGASSGSTVKVCWQGNDSLGLAYAEIISSYYSTSGGIYKVQQQKHECYRFLAWCSSPVWYSASTGKEDTAASEDYSCFDISTADTPQTLNLMSLANGVSYKLTFNGTAPTQGQGYRITSVGEVKSGATGGGSLAGATATRKKVVVEKSRMPNLGPWFDFAAVSVSGQIVAEN